MRRLTVIAVFVVMMLLCGNSYAMSEVDFVASVIAAEAVGDGYEGMYAVACVIQNRMATRHKTAYQVVTQRKQFFGATSKNRLKLYNSVKSKVDVIAKNIGHLKDITNGATHFENIKAFGLPYWATIQCATIGNHTFYK